MIWLPRTLFLFISSFLFPFLQTPTSINHSLTGQTTSFETGKSPTFEIHISSAGSDFTGDGSPGNPYASIGRAVQDAIPGAAVRIHPGTYPGGTFINDLSGTADAPIWIGGAPGEPRPVIDSGGEGLHFSRVRYLVIHDLEVRNTDHNGINTDDGGEYANPEATRYVIFRGLSVHHVGGSGNQDCLKLSGVNDYIVLNSEFAHCGGGGSGSGIDHVGCHQGLILGNYLHDLSGNAIQTKGGSEDIEIRANRMVNSGHRAVNIGGSTGLTYFRPPLSTTLPNFEARNIRVVSNQFEGGITSLAFVGAVDSLAANNTIINPSNWLLRILQETNRTPDYEFLPSSNNQVVNNIFYFEWLVISTYVNIGPNTAPDTFLFANNLWYAHDRPQYSQPALPVPETNGVSGSDPLFQDSAAGNFHLQADSPASGTGTSWEGITTDFDGFVFNNPPSMGAFEENPIAVYLPFGLMR